MALKQKIDALIVGAGPVGLTAALTLVRQGHRHIEIIDEAEQRTGLSYALALHSSTLERLDELGIAAELIAAGNRIDRVGLYDGPARRAELAFGTPGRIHPFVLAISQSEIERVLLAALAAEGIEVRWRHRLRKIAESDEAVTCAIDRIDSDSSGYAVTRIGGVVGKSFEREIPLLIGADGHGSFVRRQLGIELEATGAAGTVAVFELEGEPRPTLPDGAPADNEMRLTLAGGMRSVWWPLPGGRTRLGFELPSGAGATDPRDKSRLPPIVPWLSSPIDERRLDQLLAESLPWHPSPTGRLMWSASVRFERAVATSFGRGRVWLVGDAAHLAFPFGVHSMNDGIVEAGRLGALSGRVLAGADPLSLLERDGRERRASWRAPAETARASDTARDAGTAGANSWLIENRAAIVEALPVARGEAAELLAGAESIPAG